MILWKVFFAGLVSLFASSVFAGEILTSGYVDRFGVLEIRIGEDGKYQLDWDRKTCLYNEVGLTKDCESIDQVSVISGIEEDVSLSVEGIIYKRYRFIEPRLEQHRLVVSIAPGSDVGFRFLTLDAELSNVKSVIVLNKLMVD